MDPQRLASVGNDGILRLWDMEAGMEVLTPSGNKTNLVSVSWSPDGQQLIAGRRREDQDLDHHEARATPLNVDGYFVGGGKLKRKK